MEHKKIAIVGSPNVGKSVLFGALTGQYVIVSNYPGTTVEVSRGKTKIAGAEYEVIDTPGMYSLLPITEEERVSRNILMQESPDIIIHVVDAKIMERMLPLTIQLIEAGFPTILALNVMDEARKEGVSIDSEALSKELRTPVIEAVFTSGEGIERIKGQIQEGLEKSSFKIEYSINEALESLEEKLKGTYPITKRSIALLLVQEDKEIADMVREKEGVNFTKIEKEIKSSETFYINPITYEFALTRQNKIEEIVSKTMKVSSERISFQERLSRLTMNPLTGFPILFLVLYWGLYKFVGEFGAGKVVNFLEGTIFEGHINPFVIAWSDKIIPWAPIRDLVAGDYGVITLGVRYAVALILPIVTFFFIIFSIIEDSGYLPRLAMLIDRFFKKIGLSGRAVIPMVLGIGCATMATMVTRTLPTKRERIISTMLLALAIPCSAQLGVILALFEGRGKALALWAGVIVLIFLVVGYLTAKLLPGKHPSFYMELPPLRVPKISNVFIKTYVRVKWYFKEILPMFIMASVLIWLGQITHVFEKAVDLLKTPVRLVGLPEESAPVFIFGFFRRDYGAAGLYDLSKQGLLDGRQLLVACVALTLFLPCIAQLLMNIKERGWKVGVAISFFVLLFSFTAAYVLNLVLVKFGVVL